MDLTDLQTIKSLLERHNLRAKKFLGQNFLIDPSALEKIIETGEISKNDHVIEIGPGLGVLTKELAQKAKKITSIELDKTLFPLLEETLSDYTNIEILHKDALQFIPPDSTYKVIANIPYNITSPLLNHFLQAQNKPTSITMLVQKEVAEKICDKPPKMSILSLQVALFGEAEYIRKVPKTSFHPSPKVDSAIIHIKLYNPTDVKYFSTEEALKLLKLAKQAFIQKRKKLRNTLPHLIEKLEKLKLSNLRPQDLSIEKWQELLK